jgi:hypothetical protein
MSRVILSVLFLITFLASSALGVCTYTPGDPYESMDNMHLEWCTNNTHRENLWNCLSLGEEEDFWLEQLALDGPWCSSPFGATTRLFNAQWFIGGVQWNRSNNTLSQSVSDWYNYVCDRSPDGYKNVCGNTSPASNPQNSWEATILRPRFYETSVPVRGGLLVHEATHEDVRHCCSGSTFDCDAYCGGSISCGDSVDWSYGLWNATGKEIDFLRHAISAYQKDAATNELIILEDPNTGDCGYIPLITEEARNDVNSRLWFLFNNCYVFNPLHPERHDFINSFDDPSFPHSLGWMLAQYPANLASRPWLSSYEGPRFPCEEICDPSDYLWPDGEHACNVAYNDQNAGINSWNWFQCGVINASVYHGAPASVINEAQQEWLITRKLCNCYVDGEYLEEYCLDLIADGASSVDELEEFWDLDDEPCAWFPNSAINDCIKLYCQEEFDLGWINIARGMCYEWDDPLGCLDEVCGKLEDYDDESLEYFESLQCRRHYIEHYGNIDAYYDELEGMGKCELMYTHCKNGEAMEEWLEAKQNGECNLTPELGQSSMYQVHILNSLREINYDVVYDDLEQEYSVSPGKCEAVQEMCEKISELNSRIAAKFLDVSEAPIPLPEDPWIRSKFNIDIGMQQLAESIASPTFAFTATAAAPTNNISGFTQKEAIHQLTHVPEYLHALSDALGKDAFFGLYGGKGLEKIFGEETALHFPTAEIQFGFELTPEQELLLPEFNLHKETRERIESSEILEILEALAISDPERLFNFMKDVYHAPSIEDLNTKLDELTMSTEACCDSSGECSQLTPANCLSTGGLPLGLGTTCDPNLCPIPSVLEACCLVDGLCVDVTQIVCIDELSPPGIPIASAACLGDLNGNGIDDLCEGL